MMTLIDTLLSEGESKKINLKVIEGNHIFHPISLNSE